MKSSTSQRAGSSRTFLNMMYLTSGAYVITRRLRTWRSPVVLYSRQSASASSAETRRRLLEDEGFMRYCAPKGGGHGGAAAPLVHTEQGSDRRSLYRVATRT